MSASPQASGFPGKPKSTGYAPRAYGYALDYNDQRPFFLTMSLMHPHDPYLAPRRHWERYRDEKEQVKVGMVRIDPAAKYPVRAIFVKEAAQDLALRIRSEHFHPVPIGKRCSVGGLLQPRQQRRLHFRSQ